MSWWRNEICGLGRFGLFVGESLFWLFRAPYRWRLVLDEIVDIGLGSVAIVFLTALFSGAVFAYQAWLGFVVVGTTSLVGASVGVSVVREIAPILASIVVAGRAGAAMAAQIGLMRVTEQIDALELMAVSPKQYLVSPRILAGAIAVPVLVAIFGLVANLGGWFVGTYVCNIDPAIYIEKLREYVWPLDVMHGLVKAVFFGFMLTAIGCYKGYHAKDGAAGVGKATNETVVFAIVTILVSDYFLSILVPVAMRTQ